MTKEKDKDLLQTLLAAKIQERRISEREVARETGLSATTIGRLLSGKVADIETILVISKWLKVSPSYILSAYLPETDGFDQKIALLIEAEPRLKEVFEALVNKLQKGEIDPRTVNDILAYTAYRLNAKT